MYRTGEPVTVRPDILLCAPAAARYDASTVITTSAHVLPATEDAMQGAVNTVVVPARLVPMTMPVPGEGASLQPLFLLRPADQAQWLPYTLMSYTGDEVLYVRLPGPALTGSPDSPRSRADWASDLSARHQAHAGQLNNHRLWFRYFIPGWEAEHKFTLPPGTDIWHLAIATHQQVRAGTIRGWICEHGNNGGFEQWDFTNHLFEITDPDSERGYIAFMPAVNGTGWVIRRKRFPRDQPVRQEDITHAPDLTAGLADLPGVIRDRYGLTPAWGAVYRRVRYNVMLESLATGHLFTIMYDRCTTPGPAFLVQAEVEYLRSRTLHTYTPRQVLSELGFLASWTRKLLASHGITPAEDHLSKLTWLRRQHRPDKQETIPEEN